MKREILWDPSAWAELDEAFDMFATGSREAAEGFRKQILTAVTDIAENGEAHPLFDRDARRILLGEYPYGLLFTLNGEYAAILVVMRTSL